MRGQLKSVFQPNPIEVERFLQGRASKPDEPDHIERPEDDTLEAAVARMSEAARKAGRTGLIMSPEEWQKVILPAIRRRDMGNFAEELHGRAGGFESVDDANKWLALATNIWNNTPQPDRGGKSARQMLLESGHYRRKPSPPGDS